MTIGLNFKNTQENHNVIMVVQCNHSCGYIIFFSRCEFKGWILLVHPVKETLKDHNILTYSYVLRIEMKINS